MRGKVTPMYHIAPQIFVGSASEHADVLKRLGSLEVRTGVKYLPWTDPAIFITAGYTLPSLCRILETVDGAAFLSMSVDKTWWRGQTVESPRDNVILEVGLAIGFLGVERTAIVTDAEAKLPSDLKGLNTLPFSSSGDPEQDVAHLHAQLDKFFCRLDRPKRAVQKMWNQSRYSVYFHSFDNPERGEIEEIVNFNAARAIGYLSEALGQLRIIYSVHSSRLEELHVEDNLILLGSSASNAVTIRLSETGSDKWRFACMFDTEHMGNRLVLDRATGKEFSTFVHANRIQTDYGILTRVRNPYSPEHWIVIASGNYGYGTLGAVRAGLDASNLASLPFDLDTAEFQILVEVPVTGKFSSGKARLLASEAITT